MKKRSESVILKRVMLEASRLGHTVFRNHVGGFYAKDGSFHRTGLCKGSADLIGWMKDGRFLAIEVKKPGGRLRKEQRTFLDAARKAGGVGIVCDDEMKLEKLLAGKNYDRTDPD